MREIIICDDQKHWCDILRQDIGRWASEMSTLVSFTVFAKGGDLVNHFAAGARADAVFLDVEFGDDLNGMEVAKRLRDMRISVPIIFVSSHALRANEGYFVDAIGFLVKEYRYDELKFFLEKAQRHNLDSKSRSIAVESDQEIVRIEVSDIFYIESYIHDATIHTAHGEVTTRKTLNNLLNDLGTDTFVQVHKSYIVALQHIVSVKTTYPYSVKLRGGKNGDVKSITIGRSFFKHVQEVYAQFVSEGFL